MENYKITLHKTSIEAARSNSENVTRYGQKRTYDQSSVQPEDVFPVLVDITNQREFHRPVLRNDARALKASDITTSVDTESVSAYSQRKHLALTPGPTANPYLGLGHPAYALPPLLVQNFASLGIKSIYPWQSECLLRSGALAGERNLVYTAPTGGGKSLVADILMLKKVIESPGKKALLVLPYVALVQEKLRWLRNAVEGITRKTSVDPQRREWQSVWRKRGDEESVRVVGFFGGSKGRASWADMDIAVCTLEKANSLVNAAIEECSIDKLGIVVIDELHMITDSSRGYILELMATKLLSLEGNVQVQVVGMSATLSDANILAKWLDNAKFYISKYRPVPVEEHLVFDNKVYPASSSSRFYKTATELTSQAENSTQPKPEAARIIQPSQYKEFSNPLTNAVVALANETARAGYGALVFCSSKAGCERDALLISQVLPQIEECESETAHGRRDLLSDLRSTPTGLDIVLGQTVPRGVAYHHAGLTTEERELVASAYDNGILKVLVATCGLAAGINLPARRVILHGARMGADLVGPSMLRQMRGRAGRKGKDEVGESYLCCQKSDLEAVAELMEAEIPNVESCLLPDKIGIKRALLEIIATKLATSVESIHDYVKKTLLYQSISPEDAEVMTKATLEELKKTELIIEDDVSGLTATLVGEAIVASSLTPEDGIFVHKELRKSLQAFVLDAEMHILYTFTPIQSTSGPINWRIFRKEVESFDESNLRALGFIGLKPQVINKMAQGGTLKETTPAEVEIARIYRRFYSALQLRDLCNEVPIFAVARKYDLPRGAVQSLAQTCHGFAAGMIKFCERMNWGALVAVLDHFSDRLKAGARADLLALAQVTFIKSRTARIFWDNGYKSVGAVAAADAKELIPILLMAQPKKLRLEEDDEEKYHRKMLAKAEVIVQSANRIWERQMQAEVEDGY